MGQTIQAFQSKMPKTQIYPGLNAIEIQIPYDNYASAASSLVKSHQNTHNFVKYEVQYYENVK